MNPDCMFIEPEISDKARVCEMIELSCHCQSINNIDTSALPRDAVLRSPELIIIL